MTREEFLKEVTVILQKNIKAEHVENVIAKVMAEADVDNEYEVRLSNIRRSFDWEDMSYS